jgi:hypothetical protein
MEPTELAPNQRTEKRKKKGSISTQRNKRRTDQQALPVLSNGTGKQFRYTNIVLTAPGSLQERGDAKSYMVVWFDVFFPICGGHPCQRPAMAHPAG